MPTTRLISDLICTGLLFRGSAGPPGPKEKQSIQADIDDQDSSAQCHLGRTGQAWRIKEHLDIMFNKDNPST